MKSRNKKQHEGIIVNESDTLAAGQTLKLLKKVKSHSLNLPMIMVINNLVEGGEKTVERIARDVNLSMSATHKLIKYLKERDYLSTRVESFNHNQYVSYTATGLMLVRHLAT